MSKLSPQQAEAALQEAVAAHRQGQLAAAEKSYARILKSFPGPVRRAASARTAEAAERQGRRGAAADRGGARRRSGVDGCADQSRPHPRGAETAGRGAREFRQGAGARSRSFRGARQSRQHPARPRPGRRGADAASSACWRASRAMCRRGSTAAMRCSRSGGRKPRSRNMTKRSRVARTTPRR